MSKTKEIESKNYKICPKCGHKNKSENSHCEKCGYPLDLRIYQDD